MKKIRKFLRDALEGEEATIEFDIKWYHVIAFFVFLFALVRFIVLVSN